MAGPKLDTQTTDATGLVSNKYFARRLTDAANEPAVKKLLPRVKPKNPLTAIDERRKNPGYAEYMLRDSGLDATNPGDQQDLHNSLSQFMTAQKDKLTTADSVAAVDRSMQSIYDNSKHYESFYAKASMALGFVTAPLGIGIGLFSYGFYKYWSDPEVGNMDYMHKNGGAYHQMEAAFHKAKAELKDRHVREVVDYADILQKDPDLLAKAQKHLSLPATTDSKELAKQMLAPAQKKEENNLEQSIDNSKTAFANKIRRNLELARLYANIDKDTYAVAKENQRRRCERERAAKAQSPVSGLFDITQSKELEFDEDPDNDLPKIKDFTGDFVLDLGRSWTWFGIPFGKAGITVAQRDGVMSLDFSSIHLNDIEGNPDVEAAITNLIEMLWLQEENVPESQRSVELTCDNEEVARVMARAALRKGYDINNVKIKMKDKDWPIPQDIKANARNAREAIHDVDNSSRVVRAIDNVPDRQTQKELAKQYKDDPIGHNRAIVQEYEQLKQRVDILNDISAKSRDKSSDKNFIQAVDKLNTIPLEQSNIISRGVHSARDSFKGTNDRRYSDISAIGCTSDKDRKTIGDAASLRASKLGVKLQKLEKSYVEARDELKHSAEKAERMAMRAGSGGQTSN